MDADARLALQALVEAQPVAALGTLQADEPLVSMVPFALPADGSAWIIHISRLAAHTRNIAANPGVSVMVMASPVPGTPVQGLARVTVQGDAHRLDEASAGHAVAKAAYLARFPDTGPLFNFADFALYAIHPRSARWVGGYALARTISGETLAEILRRS